MKLSSDAKHELYSVMQEMEMNICEACRCVNAHMVARPQHQYTQLIDLAALFCMPTVFTEVYRKIYPRNGRYFSGMRRISYWGYGADWRRTFLRPNALPEFRQALEKLNAELPSDQLGRLIEEIKEVE